LLATTHDGVPGCDDEGDVWGLRTSAAAAAMAATVAAAAARNGLAGGCQVSGLRF